MNVDAPAVLTLNVGSSSLKFCIYEMQPGQQESLIARGAIKDIGSSDSKIEISSTLEGELSESVDASQHAEALSAVLSKIGSLISIDRIRAVGHRVVQGGPHHTQAELVTPTLLKELRALSPQDPPHLPAAIAGIEAAQALGSNVKQVACFDTAFHRAMPPVAQRLPLPAPLVKATGLLRYGFHGLSYEYVIGELSRLAGKTAAGGRVVIAHLGNGASMAALRNGRSIETTMGFTPAGGLVMGSRTGDLDPGALIYLLSQKRVKIEELNDLIYEQSGMKGVSQRSGNMQDLLEARRFDRCAAHAVELFCYQARKSLGALVAVLDGLDTLVFTGGIGEHAAYPREQICEGLSHLGLRIDARLNEANAAVISSRESTIPVRIIPTNEELMIARHTAALCFAG